MSQSLPPSQGPDDVSHRLNRLNSANRVDEICDAFEQDRATNPQPIEVYLERADLAERPLLLRELLLLEWTFAGIGPDEMEGVLDSYQRRFDGHRQIVEAAWLQFCDTNASVRHVGETSVIGPGSETKSQAAQCSSAKPAEWDLPKEFGRYRILNRIGSGGMGSVYRAYDKTLNRYVALKTPHQRHNHAELIQRLGREAQLMAALHHPGICPVFDVGQHENQWFISMALIEGQTLDAYLAGRQPADTSFAAKIIQKIALTLSEVHALGVVHRDLKPSNVMIDHRAEPIVMDFGLAINTERADARLTTTGAVVGTPMFMSPEQVDESHGSLGPSSDIYSLGAMLYWLLTGRPPFEGSATAVLAAILRDQPMAPAIIRPEISKPLEAICLKAMAKRPKDRFGSMKEFSAALADLIETRPSESVTNRSLRLGRITIACVALGAMISLAVPALLTESPNEGVQKEVEQANHLAPSQSNIVANETAQPGRHLYHASTPPTPRDINRPTAEDIKVSSNGLRHATSEADLSSLDLPTAAARVLRQHCVACHGKELMTPRLNLREMESLTEVQNAGEAPFVTPGNAANSMLWTRIERGEMPPEGRPKLSIEEQQVIRNWINAGAEATRVVRPFVSEQDILTGIRDHLQRIPQADRTYFRYFTWNTCHNNLDISDTSLRLFKAGMSKLINSLSWERKIAVPSAIDSDETVFAVDLRDLGWKVNLQWNAVLRNYPYAIDSNFSDATRDLNSQIRELAGEIPSSLFVRGDWFVATASRSPMYYSLLELPTTHAELQRKLGVNVVNDFVEERVVRAATVSSGASSQQRFFDRHNSKYGAYWTTYDFELESVAENNLLQKPLGPKFEGNAFEDHAFVQDYSEVIFTLPNKLQGYFQTDGQGNRINEGPIQIVSDSNGTAGSPKVVSGLSCMGCHRNGPIQVEKPLSLALMLTGRAREKGNSLFIPREIFEGQVARDEVEFLKAVLQTLASFMEISTVEELRNLSNEPIAAVAEYYNADLSSYVVACELGYQGSDKLWKDDGAVAKVQELGLAPLRTGGNIRRAFWQAIDTTSNSTMQKLAEMHGCGIPRSFRQLGVGDGEHSAPD